MNRDELGAFLSAHAVDVDQGGTWPQVQLLALAKSGFLSGPIPRELGGAGQTDRQHLEANLWLSEQCLTTSFILTQFHGACARIAHSENRPLAKHLLPRLAAGEDFVTLGISHLTTSRQHIRAPAVRITQTDSDLILDGMVPWVTGAAHADYIVTGGTLSDGTQALVVLPTAQPGVSVLPHETLLALTASHTASVKLEGVRLPVDHLLAGPDNDVMAKHGGGAGGLTTSALATGLATRATGMVARQAMQRAELRDSAEQFQRETARLREALLRAADSEPGTSMTTSSNELRQRATLLALRTTQAALAVSKGAGFVRGHPAELAVREAQFFLVWSCPQAVMLGVLEELTCRDGW